MEQHTAINQHSQLPNASPTQGEWATETILCTLCVGGGGGVVVNRYIYSCSPVQETFVYVSTMGVTIFTVVVSVCGRLFGSLAT